MASSRASHSNVRTRHYLMTTILLSDYVLSPFIPNSFVGQVCHTTRIICLSPVLEAASSKSSITLGSIASAVVKAQASYKYVSGAYLNATPYLVWMGLPLVLAHAGAYPGTPVIRSLEKPTFPGKFQFQTIKITKSIRKLSNFPIFSGQNPVPE